MTALPIPLELIKDFSSIRILAHRETRPHLPPKAVALAWYKRDAEAAFAVYISRDIGCKIHQQEQGRRIRLPLLRERQPPGISPLSRYRDRQTGDLTLGIAHGKYEYFRLGFTDLSRYIRRDCSRGGQLLTRQGTSLSLVTPNGSQIENANCKFQIADSWGARHFCLPLHVAMQLGLYHRQKKPFGAWRIVSEDSGHRSAICNFHFAICNLQ